MPEVRYASAAGASIAYQLFGHGERTVVAVPPLAQNVELVWQWPDARRMLEGFGAFCRYLQLDKRGTGMSSRDVALPGVERRIADLSAVMDHAGVDRAVLYGVSEGGPMTLLFAAAFPDRVEGVVLESTAACLSARPQQCARPITAPDWPAVIESWGTARSLTPGLFAPSLATDPAFARWHQHYERQSASPSTLLTLLRMNGLLDARDVLADIRVPVLVIHRTDDPVVPVELARETAAALPDARLVEMAGADHFSYASDVDTIVREIGRFVTGRPPPRLPRRDSRVRIRTLGAFEVSVDGRAVTASTWGSRRARQLLKRLVVARGAPVSRDALVDQLWPGHDDLARLGARLSVQLSTVRRVVGGDRVLADDDTVALDVALLDVDVEELLRLRGRAVLDAWTGDLLPEDDADWADGLRQEVRAHVVAAGHEVLLDGGGYEERVRAGRVVLDVEPYAETALLGLVRAHHEAGVHGAAHQAHEVYQDRMAELGLAAQSLAAVLADPG